MKRNLYLIFVLCFAKFSFANENIDQYCKEQWEELDKNLSSNYQKMLPEWLKLESSCKNTGYYEFRLSALYERNGDLNKAKAVVESTLANKKTDYEHLLKLNRLIYRFSELATSRNQNIDNYNKLINDYIKLADDYPNWGPPHGQLASTYLFIGEQQLALQHAKKAVALNEKSWTGYRALVLAYAGLKDYEKARLYIMKALKLNESLLADTEIMYAAAITYIKLNEIELAEKVLILLKERNPAVSEDEYFQQIVKFFLNKKSSQQK